MDENTGLIEEKEEGRELNSEDQKKNIKKKKLARAMRRCFLLGFVFCIITVLVLTYIFDLGRILVGGDYREYKSLKERYGKYNELLTFIDEEALADYNSKSIDDDMIREVVASLDDPYAQYYTAEEYQNYMKNFNSSYSGIGVAIADTDYGVMIFGIIQDSPAEAAGLKEGDIIVEVDGKSIKTSDEATAAMMGKAGTEVEVVVKREDSNKSFKLTRAEIEQKSVAYEVYDKDAGIGYLRLALFKEDSTEELKLAVKDLKSQGCKKIIIDLRDNGGGLTNEAYKIADFLLPEGIICTEKNKAGEESVHKSKASSAEIKYVLLVNGNTASASELLAAAVQDNKGGLIIGTKTYGKGVTQKTHTFSDGSVVKLTIEEYFRPSGKKVNGVGVTPDIIVENDDEILDIAAEKLKNQ